MDEREAIEHLRAGDSRGLEVLVRLHQVQAIRTAYLITRDVALAQDVVQATFLRAYERIDQLDPHRPFAPWFLSSVVHDAIKACMAVRLEQTEASARSDSRRRSRPLSVDAQACAQGGLRLEQRPLQVRLVIWLTMMVRHPARSPLGTQLANIVQAAADKREHVLEARGVRHRPLPAARDVDRRGVREDPARPGVMVGQRCVVGSRDACAEPAIRVDGQAGAQGKRAGSTRLVHLRHHLPVAHDLQRVHRQD